MTGDTAVSVLTPPGSGAIATVAVRGPNAWQLVKENFRPAKGSLPDAPELRRVWFGNFGAGIGDEVILGGKAADEFEIHCHGGVAVVRWIVGQFTAAGCVECNPFEFDRTGVDPRALEPLTRATTVRTAAILLDQLNGAWLRGVAQTSPPSPLSEAERGNRNGDHLPLCVSERGPGGEVWIGVGRHLVTPWKVVIAGPPNVGKSSLINAVAGFQRSVVAPIPGTTRDVVRVQVAFDGWPVELCDTAGMRTGADELETAGIDRARAEYARADLRIWVVDLAADVQQWPDLDPAPEIVVGNKVDAALALVDRSRLIPVSATRGDGLPELIAAIVKKLVPNAPPSGAAVPFTPALCDAVESAVTTGTLDSPR